jgi:hypothetical protein
MHQARRGHLAFILVLALSAWAGMLLAAAPGWAAATCRIAPTGGLGVAAELRADDTLEAFPEIDQKLVKGLAVTIVHEVALDGGVPFVFGCKLYYDLWDESYGVTQFKGGLGASGVKQTVRDRRQAVALCQRTALPFAVAVRDQVEVTTHLDPVSDEQLAKTRRWLAEKGISSNSGAFFGRAAYAIVNLKQQKVVTRRCEVRAEPVGADHR